MGPGTAMDMSLKVIEVLMGKEKAMDVASKLIYEYKVWLNIN